MMLAVSVFTFGQTDYVMFKTVYMKPDYANLKDLGKAMTEYNKTYANEAPFKGHVWVVNSGPRTGEWLYVMGPLTFTDIDSREVSDDQRDLWLFELMPNVKSMSDGSFWRMDADKSYEGTGEFTGKEVLTYFKIKNGEEYRFKQMVADVKEVYEAKSYPNFFQLYYSQFSKKCGYDVLIAGGISNWADFDNRPNFKADYEEVHGEGSFQKLLDEYDSVVENEYDEIIMYIEELSSDRE